MSNSNQSVQSNNVSSMTQKPRPQDELKNYMFMFMDCAELPRLYPSEWNSLYISNLPAGIHSVEAITEIAQSLFCIGKVSRVDIISTPSYKGGVYMSAFIHFEYWYKTSNAEHIRNSINRSGKCDVYGYYNQTYGRNNYTDTDGRIIYFRFAKNTTPIPEIHPNTVQLVENLAIAVKRIDQLEQKLAKMQEQLADVICIQIQSQEPYDPEMGDPEYYREHDCDNDYHWDQVAFRADQQFDAKQPAEYMQQKEFVSNSNQPEYLGDLDDFDSDQKVTMQPTGDRIGEDGQLYYTDQTVVDYFTSEQEKNKVQEPVIDMANEQSESITMDKFMDKIMDEFRDESEQNDQEFVCEKCERIDQPQYTGQMPFPNSIQETGSGWASYHDRPMNVCEFCATCQYDEWTEFCANAFIELPENETHYLCDVCEETKQSMNDMNDDDYAFVHSHGGYVNACIYGYTNQNRNLAKYVNEVTGIMVCEDCPLPGNGFIKKIRKR